VQQPSAEAYWTVQPGRGEIRPIVLPAPAAGQALVHTLYSGISRGTELLVHRGGVPPSEHVRMRAPHQEGDFPFPVKYGYCNVGRVVTGPAELIAREVFCLYPHQSAYVVDAGALHVLPEGVPAHRAVLAASMETALNAVWDAELKAGDRVAVVGAGAIGLLVAYLAARHPGTEVEVIDVDRARAEAARALDLKLVEPGAARGDADLVVHASASSAGLQTALDLAAREATVLELSWYGEATAALALGGAFHALRLRLRSSQVGSLPPSQQPRWTHHRRLALALRLLADDRLERLIDASAPFAELPSVMQRMASGELAALCHLIDYRLDQRPAEGERRCTASESVSTS
jgi:threonine dehydrogenase-like Zn-dependent dehydrogenase